MEMKFRRSFLGYSPKSVERVINAIIGEFERQLKDLEEENAQGESGVQMLESELEELQEFKTTLTKHQVIEKELTKVLVSAHVAASEKVVDALEFAAQMENRALDKVKENEKEAANLKKTMDDITEEIKSLTKRYSLELEGSVK